MKEDFYQTLTTAFVGEAVTVRCRSDVEENVQWVYYNDSQAQIEQIIATEGRVLPDFADHYVLNSTSRRDHQLIIKRSKPEDTGLYGCIEESGIGQSHMSCLVISDKGDQIETKSVCGCLQLCQGLFISLILLLLIAASVVIVVKYCRSRRNWSTKQSSPTANEPLIQIASNSVRATSLTVRSMDSGVGEDSSKGFSIDTQADIEERLDYGQEGNIASKPSQSKLKFVRTIVANAENNESCSRVFTIVHEKLYLVQLTKILVYSIAKSDNDVAMERENIIFTDLQLKKPCCFTASYANDCMYLGDKMLRAIFKVERTVKSIQQWAKIDSGEVQSVSPLKDGLAVLVIEKDIEDKFWHGRLNIYGSDGTFRTEVKVPKQYFLPYCMKAIDDEHFAISYGIQNTSGVAIFNEQKECVTRVTCRENMCIPGNFWYDRNEQRFIIADAGTKQLLSVKMDQGQMGVPDVLLGWGNPGKFDYSSDSVRPVRVAYDGKSSQKRVIVALRNGRIDLYSII